MSAPPDTINILGVPVKFPFPPYDCQLEYMSKVITSLQQVRISRLPNQLDLNQLCSDVVVALSLIFLIRIKMQC